MSWSAFNVTNRSILIGLTVDKSGLPAVRSSKSLSNANIATVPLYHFFVSCVLIDSI